MLPTQSTVMPAIHAASAHFLPGAVVITGALLLLEVTAWKSWKKYRQKRQTAEAKQNEFEQKVEELQHQCTSLREMLISVKQTQQPAKTVRAVYTLDKASSSNKHALFQQIINENVAIRDAANV